MHEKRERRNNRKRQSGWVGGGPDRGQSDLRRIQNQNFTEIKPPEAYIVGRCSCVRVLQQQWWWRWWREGGLVADVAPGSWNRSDIHHSSLGSAARLPTVFTCVRRTFSLTLGVGSQDYRRSCLPVPSEVGGHSGSKQPTWWWEGTLRTPLFLRTWWMLKQNVRIKSISETGSDISMPKVSLTFDKNRNKKSIFLAWNVPSSVLRQQPEQIRFKLVPIRYLPSVCWGGGSSEITGWWWFSRVFSTQQSSEGD